MEIEVVNETVCSATLGGALSQPLVELQAL